MFITGLGGADTDIENEKSLFHPINFCKGDIFILVAGGEHHGVAPHEVEGQPPKELAGYLSLIRTLAPRQC